jgi:hypothetical protein
VLINEVVTDPQQDWDDPSTRSGRRSAGGDGTPFNAHPGTGRITSSDEWVELLNVSDRILDLTGWQLIMTDTTPATEVLGAGNAVLRFSHGGSLTHFQPGERLIIGDPRGALNNDVYLQLLDATGQLVDDVEIGDDFEGDGVDGAPFPGENGNASRPNDEAIARVPDGEDTDDDVADFVRQHATIGRSNGSGILTAALPVLNNLGTDLTCEVGIAVQNVGITTTKAILLTWGSPSFAPFRVPSGPCPPHCAGPAQVECSGLIRPGAAWHFRPAAATSGILFSASAATWPLPHADDIFADALCEILAEDVVGACSAYREFKQAFDARIRWRRRGPDPDFGPFAGEPLAVHVLRRCQPEGADGTIVSGYTAPDPLLNGRREPDFGGFAYHAPALYADWRGMSSYIYLQNLGLECTAVELWFKGQNDCLRAQVCEVPALAPGESQPFDVNACVGPNWRGSAWVRATQPLAIVADNWSDEVLMTYRQKGRQLEPLTRIVSNVPTFNVQRSNESQVNYAPLVYRTSYLDTTLWVQNLSAVVNAKVKVYFLDHSGDVITTVVDWICPRGSQSFFLPVIHNLPEPWVGSARVESQPRPFTPPPNIASIAELVRCSNPARTTPLEGFAYPLLTEAEAFDWPLGPPARSRCPGPGCTGQLAFPVVTDRSSIAIQNLVPQPGSTDIAFFLYDANGLVDLLCRTLSEQQVEYINLAIWDTLSPGFRGSAVISVTAWQHPVFDPAGSLSINPVGLAAVIVERKLPQSPIVSNLGKTNPSSTTIPGDERAGSTASPVTPASYGVAKFRESGPSITALCTDAR